MSVDTFPKLEIPAARPFNMIKAVITLLEVSHLLLCVVVTYPFVQQEDITLFFWKIRLHVGTCLESSPDACLVESATAVIHNSAISLATIQCKCLVPNQASVHWHSHCDYMSDTGFSYLCLHQQGRQTERQRKMFSFWPFLLFQWEDLNSSPSKAKSKQIK